MSTNDNFEQQSSFYDHGYGEQHMGDMGFPDLKIVDGNTSVSGKKILNIGGGNSADLWFLAGKNSVHVLDGSEVAVEQAAKRGLHAQVSDVSKRLPLEDGYFDIVVLKDILEHVYESMHLLKEAKRVTKKEGVIIISLPNHFYLPFRFRVLFGGNVIWKSLMHNHKLYFEEWNYMHIRFFTWTGVKKMLQTADLKIEKAYWDFGTLAHYSDPLMYENAFRMNNKKILSKRQWILYKLMLPGYKVFNIVFPKWIRAKIVSLAPGLLCAGFYLKVKKETE